MTKNFFKLFFIFLKISYRALKELIVKDYPFKAAALAYTTLISLVPLLSILVTFITFFPVFYQILHITEGYILNNFVPHKSDIIIQNLTYFVQQTTHLSKTSMVFLIISAILLLVTIRTTLNEIWQVEKKNKNLWVMSLYWFILISLPFLIGISLLIGGYIFSLSIFSFTFENVTLKYFLLIAINFITNTCVFSVLYIISTNRFISWKSAFLGGATAAFLLEINKIGLTTYLNLFNSYEIIYGAFAAFSTFLLWLYLSWIIIIYGALVTRFHCEYSLAKQ